MHHDFITFWAVTVGFTHTMLAIGENQWFS